MYAVIRTGGKQYRVAPGDVIRVETPAADKGTVEFGDILAVSGEAGKIGRPDGNARVIGDVVESGRGDKVLVFHYKRKKQYKKLQGHRQAYTAVRISEIAFDGQSFKAPELPAREPKREKRKTAAADESAGSAQAETTRAPEAKATAKGKGGRSTGKKSAGKKGGAKKSAGKKKK